MRITEPLNYRGGLRVGLLALAVKVSTDNKVWSLHTDESYAAYHKFTKNIVPGTIVYREKVLFKEVEGVQRHISPLCILNFQLPSKDEMEADVSQKWNRNVNFAISYLSQLRSKLAEWTSADAST